MSASTRQSPPGRRDSGDPSLSRQNTMRSSAVPERMRNDVESWVEIASQPSSSSLSSIGDEIVTTGLRVQHESNCRRRRRRTHAPSHIELHSRHMGTSSQEEYDESESEEDQVMTSSTEHISPAGRFSAISHHEYDSSDDDENATALGRAREPAFTPQPNAFSHPPSSQNARPSPGSYFPQNVHTSPHARPQYPSRANSRSQPVPTDHDAALRASLNTLLSCAAAARGLPKHNQSNLGHVMTSNEPMGLRVVPESELIGANSSRPLSPSTRARSSPSVSSQEAVEKGKRKAAAAKPAGQPRATKKKKVALAEEAMLSPTMLAWVMSAGVVVLVSVVGFGAGYVIGREVGQREALAGLNGSTLVDGGSCGSEVARSTGTGTLRRFKWGTGVAKSIVA
ncbi:hypothetical protein PVAG01_10503 [Phlyctema vagabunda]|uniref:Uncharacterized protein n=1 Tax=Phlyctema vagabunda TaxID=108571 RepID=A0ABR4P2G3_9HELO